MSKVGPLRFHPVFRRYIWGGRRLGEVLGKPIGEGTDYAESWEIVDRGDDQTVVVAGPWQGKSLGELAKNHGPELLGRHHPQTSFPLLFKLLDCNQDLSVQVHPNDEQGAKLPKPDLGKTEAWVILDAKPGAKLFAGIKRGFDRPAVEREIARNTLPLCLHTVEAKAGDCIFVPAGTVHALGSGFLVAEIQQASDTTFRLFDWNRVGTDGKPRPLHVEQGLAVSDFVTGPVSPQTPKLTSQEGVEQLVACDKFVLNRWTIDKPSTLPDDNTCRIVYVVEGAMSAAGEQLVAGQTILVPAATGGLQIAPSGKCVLLEAHLP